jgi:hypothetical protein
MLDIGNWRHATPLWAGSVTDLHRDCAARAVRHARATAAIKRSGLYCRPCVARSNRPLGRDWDDGQGSLFRPRVLNYDTLPGKVPRCSLERKFSHREHEPPCTCPVRTDGAFLFWTTPPGPHADWTSSAKGAQSIVRDRRCPRYGARTKAVVGREPWSVAPQLFSAANGDDRQQMVTAAPLKPDRKLERCS